MNKLIITLLLLLPTYLWAQSDVENIVQSVANNNLLIKRSRTEAERIKLEAKQNITPDDPTISYNHAKGDPSSLGKRNSFEVTQAFDFPSVYVNQKKVSNLKVEQADLTLQFYTQEVMHTAKQLCIEIIYNSKLIDVMSSRVAKSAEVVAMVEKQYKVGKVTVFDVSNSKIQYSSLKSELDLLTAAQENSIRKLTALNGGIAFDKTPANYPSILQLPEVNSIIDESLQQNPEMALSTLGKQISERNKKLATSRALPGFEVGYMTEKGKTEQFEGVHFGMSVPIWSNKNKVKSAKISINEAEDKYKEQVLQNSALTTQLHSRATTLGEQVMSLKTSFKELNNQPLYLKAFTNGKISRIEYLWELQNLYNIEDNILKLEKEYHSTVTELLKYKLK